MCAFLQHRKNDAWNLGLDLRWFSFVNICSRICSTFATRRLFLASHESWIFAASDLLSSAHASRTNAGAEIRREVNGLLTRRDSPSFWNGWKWMGDVRTTWIFRNWPSDLCRALPRRTLLPIPRRSKFPWAWARLRSPSATHGASFRTIQWTSKDTEIQQSPDNET